MMFDIGYNKVLSGQISAKGLFFMQAYGYPHKKKIQPANKIICD